MTKTETQASPATADASKEAAAKRTFVKPVVERQDRLPKVTGFSF